MEGTMKYIKDVPRALLDDFVDSRVVPMVGAGFSKNATLPQGHTMPDWNQLGKDVGEYIPDYEFTNAIDALSLFESQFSRVKLIELLSSALRINDIKPGPAHRSFCNLFFDTICTTNFDFLLEHTLQESLRPHSIIVSEDRLSINTREETKLIKLHGDFNHPERMVITEGDFDTFLEKNKVLATYIANIFITKTLLLVGYSFEDIDTRSIWAIIQGRLGALARPAYAVLVNASPIEVSRFERRNIKVINLKGQKSDYPSILNDFFTELKQYIEANTPQKITTTSERAKSEFKLPKENKRLCFVSAPYSRISFLKDLIYPVLEKNGITPITSSEIIMPGDNWMQRSEALINEASMVIVDVSGNNEAVKWELVSVRNMRKQLIIIADVDQATWLPDSLSMLPYLKYSAYGDNQSFLNKLENQIGTMVDNTANTIFTEPDRLLQKKEYDAAVISVFRLLEMKLRDINLLQSSNSYRTYSISQQLKILQSQVSDANFPLHLIERAREYLLIRNQLAHGAKSNISKELANDIVKTVIELIEYLDTSSNTQE